MATYYDQDQHVSRATSEEGIAARTSRLFDIHFVSLKPPVARRFISCLAKLAAPSKFGFEDKRSSM